MPSTYTSDAMRIEQQATGENSGTWGTKQNTNHTLLNQGICGMDSVVFTNVDVTLTANNGSIDQARNAILKATGTLSANVNMVVPAKSKHYVIWNATSAAYTLTVKTASGSGIVVSQGEVALLFCDGTDVKRVIDFSTIYSAMNLQDNVIQRPEFKDYSESLNSAGNITGAVAIDYTLGNHYEATLTGNVTFTFSNPPATGRIGVLVLFIKQDSTGGHTITWPASVKWGRNNTAPTPTSTAGRTDIFVCTTRNGGTIWEGSTRDQNWNI